MYNESFFCLLHDKQIKSLCVLMCVEICEQMDAHRKRGSDT